MAKGYDHAYGAANKTNLTAIHQNCPAFSMNERYETTQKLWLEHFGSDMQAKAGPRKGSASARASEGALHACAQQVLIGKGQQQALLLTCRCCHATAVRLLGLRPDLSAVRECPTACVCVPTTPRPRPRPRLG